MIGGPKPNLDPFTGFVHDVAGAASIYHAPVSAALIFDNLLPHIEAGDETIAGFVGYPSRLGASELDFMAAAAAVARDEHGLSESVDLREGSKRAAGLAVANVMETLDIAARNGKPAAYAIEKPGFTDVSLRRVERYVGRRLPAIVGLFNAVAATLREPDALGATSVYQNQMRQTALQYQGIKDRAAKGSWGLDIWTDYLDVLSEMERQRYHEHGRQLGAAILPLAQANVQAARASKQLTGIPQRTSDVMLRNLLLRRPDSDWFRVAATEPRAT